ncbi:MAG TPA: RDD family protein [Steroidobacteraceae bacterium]|nr:RDD family protein [Steroidobacteraceae bacterium]
MNTLTRTAVLTALLAMSLAALAWLPAPANAAAAGSVPASSAATASAASEAADGDAPSDDDGGNADHADDWRDFAGGRRMWRRQHHQHENDLVAVGHDATLTAGAQRDSVVAVFGSARNDGSAHADVVSVFGDTTVNGPTDGDAVAVLGSATINADVGGDVVAVLGNVTLGPAAHVHGDVVSVLGTVRQDPAAIVDGSVEHVLPEVFVNTEGLRHWIGYGLLLGRPLVIGSGLSWLWAFSFGLLALYAVLALLFRDAAQHCIGSLNANPGKSLLVAILAVLLTPLMLFLLAVTIVGIPVIPIALILMFIAGVFGKVTVLGWIGERCFGLRAGGSAPHPAAAVLVGGMLVMLVYLVPVLGFVMFILLSLLGYGAVLFAVLSRIQHTSSAGAAPGGPAPAGVAPPHAAYAPVPPEAAPAATTAAATPLPLSTLPRPGFWVRMGALFIDAVIVGVVIRVLLDWHYDAPRLSLLGLAAYGAVMWKVKGTTIGGIVFDLRVARLDSRPLDWPTVTVRALGCILSLCALGLGFIWIAVDPGHQAWHDKLAGTIVVRVPKGTPLV